MSVNTDGELIHVAAGVLEDAEGRILVQRRPDHAHVGGTWEFPGGKAARGEPRESALARELREELGIRVRAARPLIQVRHEYPEKTVLLDVWRVREYTGVPEPLEGQPLKWVAAEALPGLTMPPADRPIVQAVRLPGTCVITGPEPGDDEALLARLEERVAAGARLIQLRADRDEKALHRLVSAAVAICERYGAWLILNGDPGRALDWGAHGVHLNGHRLRRFRERPVPRDLWLSAVCHDSEELELASRLDADFVLASPVRATASHPGSATLGFTGFAALSRAAVMPVYALGGMGPGDLDAVWRSGGQGVAGISAFW